MLQASVRNFTQETTLFEYTLLNLNILWVKISIEYLVYAVRTYDLMVDKL